MARRRNILGPAVEKPLLRLHAAHDLASFWKAIQGVINVTLPGSFVGLTLQHNPIMPTIAKWSYSIPDGNFNSIPLQDYLRSHPRRRFVRSSDIFSTMEKLEKSEFYQRYMEPQKRRYAIGLFFWRGQRDKVKLIRGKRSCYDSSIRSSKLHCIGSALLNGSIPPGSHWVSFFAGFRFQPFYCGGI